MKTIQRLSILLSAMLLSQSMCAQSENLQKLIDNPDKMYSSAFVYAGTAPTIRKFQIKKGYATEADYKMPAKVGVIAFLLEDRSASSSSEFGGMTVTSTAKATKDGASKMSTYIYEQVIDDLKSQFSSKGMELLTIDKVLDTDAKKAAYESYELKELKGVKAFSGITGQGNSGPAAGYRAMSLPYFGSSIKAMNKRDQFFDQFGLDAILVVEIGMSVAGNALYSVKSDILYRNPAYGTKTTYGLYNEVVSVTFASNPYEKKPEYSGIIMTEDVPYTNKKGKEKIRKEPVGLDPNLYALINAVVGANISALNKYVSGSKK